MVVITVPNVLHSYLIVTKLLMIITTVMVTAKVTGIATVIVIAIAMMKDDDER